MKSWAMIRKAPPEVKRFVNLVFIAASEETGAYPSEMVLRGKTQEVAAARKIFREVLRRHVKRVMVTETEGQHRMKAQALRVCETVDRDSIGTPSVACLLNQDHSAAFNALRELTEQTDRVDNAVMAAWPAVRTMGLFAGLMFGKSHALDRAEQFAEGDRQ